MSSFVLKTIAMKVTQAKAKPKVKSLNMTTLKSKKTSGVWSFSTTPTQTASTKHVLVVSHTDVGAI